MMTGFGLESWLAGGAVIGLLAACWGRVKSLFARLTGLLIVRVHCTSDVGVAVAYLCWCKFKRSPFGDRWYNSFNEFIKPVGRYQVVGFEKPGVSSVVFWCGWRPVLVGYGKASGDSTPGESQIGSGVNLTFLRGTFDVDVFLVEALDLLNEQRHKGTKARRFEVRRVSGQGPRRLTQGRNPKDDSSPAVSEDREKTDPDKRLLKWKPEDIGAADGGSNPWAGLAFPPAVQELVTEAKHWLASEDWYKEKDVLWRRGVLLFGAPGTGKTSLVRAIAQDLDLPVVVFDLASFGNEDFIREWRRLLNRVPCIALIEDVDAVFKGRQNRLGEEGGGLSFDCLLNALSGIEAADGVFTVVTTNKVEDLDEALGKPDSTHKGLSTRPGRIDRVLELGALDEECRYRIARRILADCSQYVDELVRQGENTTGAQFSDLCARTALAEHWKHPRADLPIKDRYLGWEGDSMEPPEPTEDGCSYGGPVNNYIGD